MDLFLTESEVERAKRIADTRNSKNGEVPNYRETRKHGDWEIHFTGVLAEMAICKVANFPVDEHFSFGGDDHAPDLYIGEYRVEVKTALYDPPIVKLNRLTDFQSDILVMCQNSPKEPSLVKVYGGIGRQKFMTNYYTKDFGRGMRACIDVGMLTPLDKIIESIKKSGGK